MTPADILEHCIQEIESGRKTPAECVTQFPEVPDLEAQLLAVQALRAYPAPHLRPAVSRQIENRLRHHMLPPRPRLGLGRKWAVGAVMLLMALVTIVQATAVSLPGEALYAAKRFTETAQIGLTPPSVQAGQHIAFAERRLAEIARLARRGPLQPEGLSNLLTDFNRSTESALVMVSQASPGQQPHLLNTIIQTVELETTLLHTLLPNLPTETVVLVQQALAEADAQLTLAEDHLSAITVRPAPTSATLTFTLTARPAWTLTATTLPTGFATWTPPHPDPTHTPSVLNTSTLIPSATSPSATHTPPGSTHTPPRDATHTPSGHLPSPTSTIHGPQASPPPHGPPITPPNCHAQNPASPNFCTPTPPIEALPTTAPASPTPCPTNASGHPLCRP